MGIKYIDDQLGGNVAVKHGVTTFPSRGTLAIDGDNVDVTDTGTEIQVQVHNEHVVATVADLRNHAGATGERATLSGQRGGEFERVASGTDDDGTVFVATGFGTTGAAWKRIFSGPLDIRWFGADTAASNNATAFNRALAAAAGGVAREVYVPRGTYSTTAQITVASTATNPVTLFGEGHDSHISSVISGTDTNAIASSGTTFSNFVMRDLRLTGTFSRGVLLAPTIASSNVRIERCEISGHTAFSAGVTLAAISCNYLLSDVWIEDNVISGGGFASARGGEGYDIVSDSGGMKNGVHVNRNKINSNKTLLTIALFDCFDSEVSDNIIDQGNTIALDAGIYHFGYGIAVYDAVNLLECKRNRARGNIVKNAAGNGIYFESQFDSIIEGNRCYDVCKQITEPSLPKAAIASNGGNTVFSHNTVKTTNKTNGTNGIVIAGGPAPCSIVGNHVEDCSSAVQLLGNQEKVTITGNTFADCTTGVYAGVNTLNSKEVTIAGNQMQVTFAGVYTDDAASLSDSVIASNYIDTGSLGVYLGGGTFNQIAHNTIKNGSGYGIQLLAGADDHLIHGNKMVNQDNGIAVASDRAVVHSNDLTDVSGTTISLAGTGHIVRDNLGAIEFNQGVFGCGNQQGWTGGVVHGLDPITGGALTSSGTQASIYNNAGYCTVQGHVGFQIRNGNTLELQVTDAAGFLFYNILSHGSGNLYLRGEYQGNSSYGAIIQGYASGWQDCIRVQNVASGNAKIFLGDNHGEITIGTTNAASKVLTFGGLQVAQTATAQTTDGTQATLFSYNPDDNKVIRVFVLITAVQSDNSDVAVYERKATFETYTASNPTQVGTTIDLASDESAGAAAWDATIDASGTDIRVRITGQGSQTINWRAHVVLALDS